MAVAIRAWLAILPVLLFAGMIAGCATTDTVKQARGEGTKRLFPYEQKVVHAAVVAAAKARKFEIVDNGPEGLLLSQGVSWRSFGERVAVFLRIVSPRLTEVEVVSKPVLVPMNFPRDWEMSVLNEIDRSLQDTRRRQ